MLKKLRRLILILTGLALLFPGLAAAHVVVSPNHVGVGERQTFSVSVPNEKDSEVVALKLLVPAGLDDAMPTVKPGWQIQVDKSDKTISAITWSGGTIPAGQRDDFTFRAQAPAKAGQLQWKAYQTYSDGSVVAWDQTPSAKGEAEGENSGPYSITKITNDEPATESTATHSQNSGTLALMLSVVALVIAVAAMLRRPARGR